MLTIPFVTVASFRAHPTYLDTNNLRSGSSVQADQDAELFNCLLIASAQVENFCNQPIQAHIQTDYDRTFIDRHGRLKHKAEDGPVRLLQSYTYATTLTQVTSVGTPVFRVESDTQIIVEPAGQNSSWTGALQFNAPATTWELYTSWTYVAGYANTTMASCGLGATSITVSNPTGIFAGDILRIWEPGKEESVVVGAGWAGQNTTPFTPVAIPISATAFAHATTSGVTGFDQNLALATMYYAVDGLQRYGTSSANWPGAKVKSATGKKTEDASAWEQKAMRALLTYRRSR
jgi:hypothetical protein